MYNLYKIFVVVIAIVVFNCCRGRDWFYIERCNLYVSFEFCDYKSGCSLIRFGRDWRNMTDSVVLNKQVTEGSDLKFFIENKEAKDIYVLDKFGKIVYSTNNYFRLHITNEYATMSGKDVWVEAALCHKDNTIIETGDYISFMWIYDDSAFLEIIEKM